MAVGDAPSQAELLEQLAQTERELAAARAEAAEAREQQSATAEILRAISSSPTDVQPVLDSIVTNAARLCRAEFSSVVRFQDGLLHLVATNNMSAAEIAAYRSVFPRAPGRHFMMGRAFVERRPVHVEDVFLDRDYDPHTLEVLQPVAAYRSYLAVPIIHNGVPLGTIGCGRREVKPFSVAEIELVKVFADQAVIAIENTRLFSELQDRNQLLSQRTRDLSEALERQTATAEVLKVISRSAFDLQPVLDTLIENAVRLCDADKGFIYRQDGELYRVAVSYGHSPEFIAVVERNPIRQDRGSATGRAVLERRVVHIPDILADPEYRWAAEHRGAEEMHRTILAVPMLRERAVLGVIVIRRTKVEPFTAKQIELVTTFADQAVIAIENVRLFREIQDRVEELQALGEVSQAVVSSLDFDQVLATILGHAVELIGAEGGAIYEFDDDSEEFRHRATHNLVGEPEGVLPTAPLRLGEGAIGTAGATRAPVQVADIAAEGTYESRLRDQLLAAGFRSLLALPLLREERLLGGLVIARKTPGLFPPSAVELVQTFASQSSLAIQNARLYREVEEKSLQLEVASRHKSEFLANMSHELRTPLNAIIGFSEVLSEQLFGELNERQLEYQKDILSSGQHLLSLINDILDLSKVEAGRMELEVSTFSLRQALENGLTMLKERAARHGISLALEIEDGLDEIEADERKVKQVVFNLLSNAVKFTPDGGRVDLSARTTGDGVEIAVRDTGIGISPEDLEHVFDEFRQVGSGTAKAEGTGLGLSLTKKLVELHGGSITAESEAGVGSTFTLRLPARPPAAAEAAPQVPADSPAEAGNAPTVLVVEDDPRSAELLRLHLAGAGFGVALARDGAEGLDLARRLRPCAVALDIELPKLDGWGFLARVKADPTLAEIPVVIVSMLDERGRGFALGAADYLVKPVGREDLLAALRRAAPDPRGPDGPGTVLAIDDDPLAVELVEAVLAPLGYAVLKATDGEAGVGLARRERPSLIILDLTMPGVDGFAVVERLRADSATAEIPVVVLTARSLTPEDKARLRGRISHLAEKGAFDRAGFVDLVRRFASATAT